jgi:ATP-dependent protease ClpP protease subunit
MDYIHEYDVNVGGREIYLYPDDREGNLDFNSVKKFQKNLNILESESFEPITIYMASHGGPIPAGMAMYDIVRSANSYITVKGYGTISSMGTIVMQAADHRVITPYCKFLIHSGSVDLTVSYAEAKNTLDWMAKMFDNHLDIYAERCIESSFFKGYTKKEVVQYLIGRLEKDPEWFLKPREALKLGFVDEILKYNRRKSSNVQRVNMPRT